MHHPCKLLQGDAAIYGDHDSRNCFAGAFTQIRAPDDSAATQSQQLQEAVGVIFYHHP